MRTSAICLFAILVCLASVVVCLILDRDAGTFVFSLLSAVFLGLRYRCQRIESIP